MTGKKIAGKASFQLVRFILFLTRILPVKASYAICNLFTSAGTLLKSERKRIALANLEIVFPGKTDEERKSIFRESLFKMFKNYFEICFIANGKWSARDIEESVTVSGLEYLDNLKESGKGALLYSGHFGNFPLMVIWLAMKGYSVAVIYKEAKNFPDDFFGNIMRRFNVTPLKYKSDPALTTGIIRALKEKKIVLVQNDQSHPDGIYINFFNKSVPSLAGPAILSKRVGVPLIPAYIVRDTSDHHHITILPEMPLKELPDQEEFISVNTQIQLDWIAGILETHPTEWLWLHNRWKRAR
jgi:KDO2-lipid IV(A) lauroyltransferase